MKTATIAEIAESIIPGFACRPVEEDKGMLQLRPYSITPEGKMNLSESKYVKCSPEQFKKYKLHEGDILFNNTNSPELVGKTTLFSNNVECVFSNHLTRIRVNRTVVNPGYVARFLHGLFLTKVFFTRCQQWVNQAAIPKSELAKIKIPLPDLKTQQKIDALLLRVESVLEKRREAIRLLDDFLKSTFLKMFGNPIKNDRRWPCKEIKNLGRVVTGSTPPSAIPDMFGEGIPFLTPGDLESNNGKVARSLTAEGVKKSRVVRAGSTLVCCIGATIGKIDVAFGQSAFNQQINAIEWFPDIEDSFGLHLLRHFKPKIIALGTSTTLPILKKSAFEKILLPIPPKPLQVKFSKIVRQAEKLIAKMKSSEAELQNLFAALMQKAFKGELVLK